MPEDTTPIVEEVVVERQRDPLSTFLAFSIFFVISVALTGVLYLLVTNVLDPVAPRTAAEAQLIAVENAVKTQPASGQAWGDYVRALVAVGDYDRADEVLQQARKTLASNDEQRLFVEIAGVQMLLDRGKYDEAYAAANKTRALEKSVRAAAVKQAKESGIRINPALIGADTSTEVYLLHARAAGALKKWDEAIESLDQALIYTPRAADLLYLRGDAHLKKGDKAKAAADFALALKYNPELTAAREGLKKAGGDQ